MTMLLQLPLVSALGLEHLVTLSPFGEGSHAYPPIEELWKTPLIQLRKTLTQITPSCQGVLGASGLPHLQKKPRCHPDASPLALPFSCTRHLATLYLPYYLCGLRPATGVTVYMWDGLLTGLSLPFLPPLQAFLHRTAPVFLYLVPSFLSDSARSSLVCFP